MAFTKTDLNKTLRVKKEDLERKRARRKLNAEGQTLGKIATTIANHLSGKNYTHYCDFRDTGDFVVCENVEKIVVTGKKLQSKIYYSYSGYKGNVKSINLENLLKKDPSKAIWFAVRGMLPKNKLRDRRMKRLKLFVGATNKYETELSQAAK